MVPLLKGFLTVGDRLQIHSSYVISSGVNQHPQNELFSTHVLQADRTLGESQLATKLIVVLYEKLIYLTLTSLII